MHMTMYIHVHVLCSKYRLLLLNTLANVLGQTCMHDDQFHIHVYMYIYFRQPNPIGRPRRGVLQSYFLEFSRIIKSTL